MHRPQLLFLDEPTSGVDPMARRAFWDLIYALVSEGVTVMVTTHYMDEAEYCGRVGIMQKGKLLAMDLPSTLKTGVLPGQAWDVSFDEEVILDNNLQVTGTSRLLSALGVIEEIPGVHRVGLAGDHLRVITAADLSGEQILQILRDNGISGAQFIQVEPTLEDVFLALTRESL